MQTFEQVKNILRENKTPFVELHMRGMYGRNSNIGIYNCVDCEESDTPEVRTEKAISWIERMLMNFTNNYVFILTAGRTLKSNQNGVIGPFEFVKQSESPEKNEQLAGIPSHMQLAGLGYLTPGEMEAKLLTQQIEFDRRMNEIEKNRMQSEFENKLKQRELELKHFAENLENVNKSSIVKDVRDSAPMLAGFIRLIKGEKVSDSLFGVKTDSNQEKKEPTLNDMLKTQVLESLDGLQEDEILFIDEFVKKYKTKKTQQNEQRNETATN